MRLRIALTLALPVLLAASAVAGLVSAQSAVAAAAAPAADPVDAFAARYAGPAILPGMVVAVGKGDAPTVFHSAGRIAFPAAAPAAGPDSLWRIYSMTKPVTGIAAMILIQEGKLRLDQPIADFIPAFRAMRVLNGPDSLASHPATRPITVRNLLTHTAGLGYHIVTKGPLLREFERLGLNTGAFNAYYDEENRAAGPRSLAEFADRLASLPLIAEPGTRWSYSYSIDLLGRVIEVASGMPFDRFVEQRILTPLKMRSSFFTVPPRAAARLATNYMFFADLPLPIDPGRHSIWLKPPAFPYGGAGLVSSARDYDRFLHMLENEGALDGVRILKPEIARLAMSNLLPDGIDTKPINAMTGNATASLGFGAAGMVYLADMPGGPAKGSYGWSGAAGSLAWVDRARKVRGVMMVNYFGRSLPIQPEIMRIVYAGR